MPTVMETRSYTVVRTCTRGPDCAESRFTFGLLCSLLHCKLTSFSSNSFFKFFVYNLISRVYNEFVKDNVCLTTRHVTVQKLPRKRTFRLYFRSKIPETGGGSFYGARNLFQRSASKPEIASLTSWTCRPGIVRASTLKLSAREKEKRERKFLV